MDDTKETEDCIYVRAVTQLRFFDSDTSVSVCVCVV